MPILLLSRLAKFCSLLNGIGNTKMDFLIIGGDMDGDSSFWSYGRPSYSKFVCWPSISGLLSWCGPATVFWSVVATWVDAVNRESVWGNTHIIKESLKSSPLFTVGDICVPLNISVAPALHGRPATIRSAVAESVGSPKAANDVSLKASTASCVPLVEIASADDCRCPTFTQAVPSPVVLGTLSIESCYSEPSEFESNHDVLPMWCNSLHYTLEVA